MGGRVSGAALILASVAVGCSPGVEISDTAAGSPDTPHAVAEDPGALRCSPWVDVSEADQVVVWVSPGDRLHFEDDAEGWVFVVPATDNDAGSTLTFDLDESWFRACGRLAVPACDVDGAPAGGTLG